MNTKLFFILISLSFFPANAQFGSKQIISDVGGAEVYTFDIDGDNDLDILLSGSYHTSWFENLDGLGSFGAQRVISDEEQRATTFASDLDSDGDLDVLSVLYTSYKDYVYTWLVWYENLDGQGNFGSKNIIEFDDSGYLIISRSVYSIDIDGDGDMDVLTGAHGGLFWYENLDGLGNFSSMKIITIDIAIVGEVYADDIDGDGDVDVLACSFQENKITWYENLDGLGTFGDPQIIADNIGEPWSIYISDLNGDGYNDVLTAFWDTGELSWFKNIDGQGNFGEQQIITNNTQGGYKVYAADIDNDGDMDVFSSSFDSPLGTNAWYENDGEGVFGTQQIIHQEENFGFALITGDIDNDNDVDVAVSSSSVGTAWFENLLILSTEDNDAVKIKLYPNPVTDFLLIKNTDEIESVYIYDAIGRLLLQENQNFNKIDVSLLDSGMLFVKINSISETITFKVIKK